VTGIGGGVLPVVSIVSAMLARAVGLFFRGSAELGVKLVAIGEKMLEQQDEHTQIITEFRDQTLQGFVTPDTKYGRISDNMDCIIDEMRNERKETRESMAKLTDTIIELARSREQK